METTKQKTLKGSFSLFGKGLHTGLNLTVTFNPAPENTGYKIQRIDLEGHPIIDAVAEKVVDTQRGTVLANGDSAGCWYDDKSSYFDVKVVFADGSDAVFWHHDFKDLWRLPMF